MATIQYLTDSRGNRTAAVVPFLEWESLMERYSKLHSKRGVLRGIQEGLREVKQARRKGEELQTSNDFLNENGY